MAEVQAGSPRPAEYEAPLAEADNRVASFDEHDKSPLKRAQHFLHSSPSAVPLLVLIGSVAIFAATGQR